MRNRTSRCRTLLVDHKLDQWSAPGIDADGPVRANAAKCGMTALNICSAFETSPDKSAASSHSRAAPSSAIAAQTPNTRSSTRGSSRGTFIIDPANPPEKRRSGSCRRFILHSLNFSLWPVKDPFAGANSSLVFVLNTAVANRPGASTPAIDPGIELAAHRHDRTRVPAGQGHTRPLGMPNATMAPFPTATAEPRLNIRCPADRPWPVAAPLTRTPSE